MKTKEEVKILKDKFHELTDEQLKKVTGGKEKITSCPFGYSDASPLGECPHYDPNQKACRDCKDGDVPVEHHDDSGSGKVYYTELFG